MMNLDLKEMFPPSLLFTTNMTKETEKVGHEADGSERGRRWKMGRNKGKITLMLGGCKCQWE